MSAAPLPLMDKWSRNARLYNTLVGMGLVVHPIPSSTDPEKIECIYVSSELSAVINQPAENPTVACVSDTVKRAEVGDVISPTKDSGNGKVIHFPSVL